MTASPASPTIGHVFATVAKERADHAAVVADGVRLSYRHLADWAGSVAARLSDRLAPEELVAICAPRSAATVATMLGVALAGGACLPLDPNAPEHRLRALVEQSGTRTLFAAPQAAARLRAVLPADVRVLETDAAPPAPVAAWTPRDRPDGLAYVVYTSGSTGRPKGVMVEHRSLLHLVRGATVRLSPDDVVLQLAPLYVDPSMLEVWGALLNGATLVLPEQAQPSVHEIGHAVRVHKVTVLRLAAPLFRLAVEHVLDDLRGLRLLISGGDRAHVQAVRTALRALPGCRVVNGYGPTETTVYACWLELDSALQYDRSWPSVPIGRPVAGAVAHVLGPDRRPVAPGQDGELCIGGPGVARGYLGRPELTARQFIPEPGHPQRRAYLTGDRVKLLPDGNLAFLGRLDDQVKIRGHRVEPGETEHVLLLHPAVRGAAVVAHGDEQARQLTAYACLADDARITPDDLRAHLAARLPDPLVPATVEVLAALPTTPNGKVDRKLLAERGARQQAPAARSGPRPPAPDTTATERFAAALWHDVLGVPVDADTDYFAAGGDSLAAMTLLARLERERGVRMSVAEFFDAATVRAFAARVDAARPAGPAAPRTGRRRLPLLPGQQGIWFEQQAVPGGRYTISRTLLVRGPIDVPALRTALTRLGERQQALQMTVEEDVDGWWQCATADPGSGVRHVDLGALHEAGRDDRARELIARSAGADAVLGAPLLRTLVVTLAPSRTLLHFDLHHVISDDWSLDVFLCELSALYTAQLTGRSCGLAPLWLPYADYVLSALEPQPRRLAEACRFWKESLADGAASIDLVADRTRPAVLSGEGDRVRVRIGERQAARHAATARRHGMSRYMFCLAGVYAVLLAYTERDELCLGSLATVRGQAGTEQLLGYFVNLLPVRVDAGGDVTVDELFQRVKDACLAAHRHQEVPFQDVCRTLGLPGAARGSTPFQAVVNYQQRQPDALDLAGSPVEPWPVDTPGTAKFELSFAFRESGAGVDLELEFSTDLFGRSRISHLADQLATVLDRLCEDDGPLSGLDIEPPAAVRPLPLPRRPAGGTLHTLFARQAAAHPDRTAVIGDDITLDYAALDRLSDRAATRLTDHGVRPGDRVAILLERSPKLITAILGVLKAGATYVPLDPSYPDERLAHTVRDAEVRALVSSGRTGGRALTGVLAPVLDIDRLTAGDGEVSLPVSGAHDPAYIIYTSGSTGRPKGVVVSHGAVANTLQACLARHPFRQDDVWLQLTSPGFDVAAFEQFMPLISGGTLVYCDDATRGDRSALTRILRERGVTVMVTVPSLLRALDRPDLAGVRILVVAGEPADIHDTRHYAHDRIVINGYGPTEAAVLATTYQAAPGDRLARVPIGTPLAGTSGHILDRHGRPAAVGVPGELWLGGAGLAHGYWNRPQETQERFTTVPALAGGERLYRTGDRVRRLPDGGIDYLGRLDGQIKLRGFRIELGEIEAVLATVSGVNEAVAVLLGAADDAELAAAYVGTASPEQARSHLARLLPAYMVPTILTPVPVLPTNSHGKADRRALTALLEQHRHLEADAAHPAETADDTERGVLELWTQVAGERVRSLDDDFFTTGGDSLRAVRLLGAIERRYGRRVALRDFLETPTVRALARQLSTPSDTGPSAPVGPQDARLAPAIVFPVPAPAPAPGEPLLLTGATGFVGAHVLYELLQRTDAPVLCLVRQDPSRIGKALDQYGLDVTSHSRRIIPVPGDLTLPGLGLDGTPWEREIRQAAAIFHLGARVHHVSGYHHLVAANVNGTAELLRIAAEGRPSRFHHISTLGVFRDDRAIRTIGETTSTADENHPRGRGYAASKWSAERLVTQAVAKGAHARLYRLGRALGSTTTGMWNQDDMLTRLAMTSAELGCYPDDTRLSSAALAVDTMARALVALALAEDHPGAVYHLHHPRPTGLRQLLAPYERRSGRRVRPVTLPAWVHTLADHPELPAYVYLEHLRDPGSGTLHYTNDSTVTHLSGLGVTLPDLDPELVERWWTGGGTVTGS